MNLIVCACCGKLMNVANGGTGSPNSGWVKVCFGPGDNMIELYACSSECAATCARRNTPTEQSSSEAWRLNNGH